MMVAVPLDAGSVSAHQHGRVTQSALSSARDPIPRASAPAQNGVHVASATDDGSTDANAPPLSPQQPAESSEAAPSASAPPPADDNLMVEEFFQDMHANVTENISRLQRVNLADGWDVGTTPDDMSDDLMLGLRDGFCGALSSFSSWNSAMVGLMRANRIGEAFVGYVLGIQLPIVAYRFGQHVAVFVFIWRCRFETRRDERRGYGIRLSTNEVSERDSDDGEGENGGDHEPGSNGPESSERKIPSVRAVATALFVIALVTQCTSLTFFSDPEKQLVALSLLFSPLGVLARWRLSRLNAWRPTFPLGTFASNIIACMLSGSLGQLLAGNPGPRERIVLVSIISGFGGTLSSLAAFIVEILAGIDPVLFRFDGFFYAFASIFWAWLVGFLFSATADWADQTTSQ
jgi:fluoride ion exporter CrcB/FEX